MHSYDFLQDTDVWQNAPALTGSTKFEPRADTKNVMITGGAGFMYEIIQLTDTLTLSLTNVQCIVVREASDTHLS